MRSLAGEPKSHSIERPDRISLEQRDIGRFQRLASELRAGLENGHMSGGKTAVSEFNRAAILH